jgi:hypothetical protein
MACVLCGRLCPDWKAGYVKVDELLSEAVRASSAVEGVNSVVRMHQGRHRHVSQEMLDLKRLYWNCRVFREGKRKGRSPYELDSGKFSSRLPRCRFAAGHPRFAS